MAVDKEYWNIPKPSEDFLTTQGTNLTVFVDYADNSLVYGLSASDTTAIAGVCIALFALGVTIWQLFSARKQNRLMVTPHIILTKATIAQSRTIEVSINNNGIGPAVLTKCDLSIKGNKVTNQNVDQKYLEKQFPGVIDINLSLMTVPYYLPPSLEQHCLFKIILLDIENVDSEKLSKLLDEYLGYIEVDYEYGDIYGNEISE